MLGLLALGWAVSGCAPAPGEPQSEETGAAVELVEPQRPEAQGIASDDGHGSSDALLALARAGHESWEAVRIQGMKVGYGSVRLRETREDGQTLLRIEGVHHLSLKRFGQETDQEIRLSSVETPAGQLLRFESEISAGASPMRVRGELKGDELHLESTTAGQSATKQMRVARDQGGFFATELSLLREPMKPGARRSLRALLPMLNEVVVAEVELEAKDYEQVTLPSGTFELLRIESTVSMGDEARLTSQLWTDRTGDVLRSLVEAFQQESYRTTKELALEEPIEGDFDLGFDSAVRLSEPLESPHETREVRYRIELEGRDPASVFPSGPSQRVRSLESHAAEVTVRALRAGAKGFDGASRDRPSEEDLSPNGMIQSDDPRIVAMAEEAAGEASDPAEVAARLERYVHEKIDSKNFSQAFATASEVAVELEGDCTEHSVLLAALARARGIPARVAIGLVYVAGQDGFYYHMWNELYVDGRWMPFDATLGRGGIGAAHLKLTHSSLAEGSAYSCFLPVVEVMGRLQVEVLEVE